MSDAVLSGLLSGGGVLAAREAISWLRNRHKDSAEVDVTLGKGWQQLVGELRQDIGDLRRDLGVTRDRVTVLENERETLLDRVKNLVADVDHYRRVARSMARHVLRLRDALAAAGADVPVMPADVEDALTVIDLPNGSA